MTQSEVVKHLTTRDTIHHPIVNVEDLQTPEDVKAVDGGSVEYTRGKGKHLGKKYWRGRVKNGVYVNIGGKIYKKTTTTGPVETDNAPEWKGWLQVKTSNENVLVDEVKARREYEVASQAADSMLHEWWQHYEFDEDAAIRRTWLEFFNMAYEVQTGKRHDKKTWLFLSHRHAKGLHIESQEELDHKIENLLTVYT